MSGSARNSALKSPFDLWLKRQLQTMYDNVAQEPLPEELIVLTERDRGRMGEPSSREPTRRA
jgi:hypothetical protein